LKKIVIITPVPEVIKVFIESSIIRKSIDNQVASIEVINLREFGIGNYRQIDDSPYGGGSGMVMMAEPLMNATEKALRFCWTLTRCENNLSISTGKIMESGFSTKI
jgi:tRNA-(guanine-N1)-methyltransferase